jgi:tRNA-splicing ligase RtcB
VLGKYGISLPDRELACVPNNSKEGEDYRAAMNCALNFAWTNRQMITHWVRMIFRKVFSLTDQQVENMKLVYDVAHNIAKVERHAIDGEGMTQVVVSYEIDIKLTERRKNSYSSSCCRSRT